jgi:NAD(P)-dependent dehydrogenase (short-subunit alcohol dehydrogenase family)
MKMKVKAMSNQQKVAIVTGASQGIGAAIVQAFRERNYRVIATSRTIKPSDDPGVLAVAGDIGLPETARRVVAEGLRQWGRIDTLVNNAGVFIAKPFTHYTEEDFAAKIATNVAGFFHITRRPSRRWSATDPATS